MRITLLLIALLAVPAVCFAQNTWFVPDDFPTIQSAISDASVTHGDTVVVRAGTYVENVDFLGKGIKLKSESGPYRTVIDGNQSGSTVKINLWKVEGRLSGFTITNGSGTIEYGACKGGGVFLTIYPTDSFLITNNIITGNTSQDNDLFCLGGGIYCGEGYPVIANNIITDNHVSGAGSWGGGISMDHCSPTIRNNTILYNTCKGRGGGVHYNNQSLQNMVVAIGSNIIMYNEASSGGGVAVSSSSEYGWASLFDNIISRNQVSNKGGGLSCFLGGIPVILTNNTFEGNSADQGGALDFTAVLPTVENTILWNNTAAQGKEIYFDSYGNNPLILNYCDVDGGQASVHLEGSSTMQWQAGMIDADPLFADPSAGDYHLTYPSPCRNTGSNWVGSLPTGDIENNPRTAEGIADMGADEFYPHLYQTGDATPAGSIALKFVGHPGDFINGLVLGVNVLDPGLPCDYGVWRIDHPFQVMTGFGFIPADGIRVFAGTVPATPPAPYTVHMQAIIDYWLTDLCTVSVH